MRSPFLASPSARPSCSFDRNARGGWVARFCRRVGMRASGLHGLRPRLSLLLLLSAIVLLVLLCARVAAALPTDPCMPQDDGSTKH